MKQSFIFYPILGKIFLMLYSLAWLIMAYFAFMDHYYRDRNIFLFLLTLFIALVMTYYSIRVLALLKINSNRIFIARFFHWEELNINDIISVERIFLRGRGGHVRIKVENLNLFGWIEIPSSRSEAKIIHYNINNILKESVNAS